MKVVQLGLELDLSVMSNTSLGRAREVSVLTLKVREERLEAEYANVAEITCLLGLWVISVW